MQSMTQQRRPEGSLDPSCSTTDHSERWSALSMIQTSAYTVHTTKRHHATEQCMRYRAISCMASSQLDHGLTPAAPCHRSLQPFQASLQWAPTSTWPAGGSCFAVEHDKATPRILPAGSLTSQINTAPLNQGTFQFFKNQLGLKR